MLGLAATVRVLALILLDDPHLHDAEVYAEAGRRLLADGVLPVHNCMPLYPLVSGLTGGGLGTRLVDVALSVATAGLVHRLGWQLLGDRRAALLAGLAAALWPHLIYLSVVRLTETSFTFLVCLGLSLWLDRRILAGSIALALSVLLRPTFELLYPILAVAVAMGIHRGGLRLATRWLVVLGLAYAAVMSPWWAHNHARYGRFVRLHAGGGSWPMWATTRTTSPVGACRRTRSSTSRGSRPSTTPWRGIGPCAAPRWSRFAGIPCVPRGG